MVAKLKQCLVWVVALGLCSHALAETTFSKLVIFGDSLSDTGNVAGAITPNLPPPYFQNRISNGPVAVDVLANQLGLDAAAAATGGGNFAIVGGNILGDNLADLSRQIDRFIARDGATVDPATLFVVFMGGNDFRDLRAQTNPDLAAAQIDAILAALQASISRLISAGAQNLLIVNAPDIGRIPQTLMLQTTDPNVASRASSYVVQYNALLAQRLQQIEESSSVTVFQFDLFSQLNRILDNPGEFGFNVISVGCLDPGDDFNPLNFSFDPRCDSGLFPLIQPDFSGFAFFDSVHPTTATHALVGAAMAESLVQPMPQSRVDLTAMLLLLLFDD